MNLMARKVLAEPTQGEKTVDGEDHGRSNYQIAITVCERCGHGEQDAGGEAFPLSNEALEMARCDAQVLKIPHGNPHVGDRPRPTRATQTIPPATRRLVMRRHRNACAVPGCRHYMFVDIHHLDRRADGGSHDPERLVPLCSAHHKAEHEGTLLIEGTATEGYRYFHADGSEYGSKPTPQAADHLASAYSALKHLGFKEAQARQALEAVRPHVGADASIEYVVREALRQVSTARESVAAYRCAA